MFATEGRGLFDQMASGVTSRVPDSGPDPVPEPGPDPARHPAPCPVVFDLDGTLVHSAPDIRLGVNRVMAARGLAAFSLPEIVSYIGDGLPKLTERVMAARGLTPARFDEIYPEIAAAYGAANGEETRLYPGVADALARLAARGHRLGVCTNKPLDPARDVLARVGVADLFDVVIGGDSLSTKKPAPEPLIAAFDALGGRGLFVGDSDVDAETARVCGVPFLLFTEGYRKSPAATLPHIARFAAFASLGALVAEVARTPV